MLGQLDRIAGLSGLAGISLGIIPFDAELAVAPMLGFMMLDDVAYVETHTSEDLLAGPEAAQYQAIADGLAAEAITGDEARWLMAAAAHALNS